MHETPPSGVEIERKFLVDRAPDGLGDGEPIEQGYLVVGEDGVEVRVRRRGDTTVLTVKSGPGMVRTEEEFEIDERRFDSLWRLTDGRRLTKTRHVIPLEDGLAAEVDVYSGAHESSRRSRPARRSRRRSGSAARSPTIAASPPRRSRCTAGQADAGPPPACDVRVISRPGRSRARGGTASTRRA